MVRVSIQLDEFSGSVGVQLALDARLAESSLILRSSGPI